MNGKVTQRDIAKKAGVSHVTVSLALRGHPGIPARTQDRIKRIAEAMGYVPDPMMSALSSYRKMQRPQAFQANIAWINNFKAPGDLYRYDFNEYYEGARQRSRELGYQLEEYRIAEAGEDWRRLKRVLTNRGVQGVLLAPSENPNAKFDLDLAAFSAVRLGYSYSHPVLHTVANMQFTTAYSAVENLVRLGYERVGFVLGENVQVRTGQRFVGGYKAAQSLLAKKDCIPMLSLREEGDVPKQVAAWARKTRPDSIVSLHGMWRYGHLLEAGLEIPDRIGYADMSVPANEDFLSGVCQNSREVGVRAVDLLVGMIHRQEKGLPEHCAHLLIDGYWIEGKTAPGVSRR